MSQCGSKTMSGIRFAEPDCKSGTEKPCCRQSICRKFALTFRSGFRSNNISITSAVSLNSAGRRRLYSPLAGSSARWKKMSEIPSLFEAQATADFRLDQRAAIHFSFRVFRHKRYFFFPRLKSRAEAQRTTDFEQSYNAKRGGSKDPKAYAETEAQVQWR